MSILMNNELHALVFQDPDIMGNNGLMCGGMLFNKCEGVTNEQHA